MNDSHQLEPKGRLFDPATKGRIRQATNRAVKITFAVVAVVMGGLIGGAHHEYPILPYWLSICPEEMPQYDCEYDVWLDVMVGIVATVVCGLILAILFRIRRIHPTVTCERCNGRGWIVDLEASGGRCPLCGHGRFRYFIIEGGGVPTLKIWRLKDTDGRELLEMRSRNKDFL